MTRNDESAEAATRQHQHECGCREGAILMFVAAAAAAIYLIVDEEPRSSSLVALIVGCALFAGASVGKVVGLLIARVRMGLLARR